MSAAMEAVAYVDGDAALTGWIARPTARPRGAIAVFPTIMNTAPAMNRRAALLADAGFVVMIADFYGEPVADFGRATALSGALRADPGHYRARIAAAIAALRTHDAAAGLPIGAIGYCMGGQAVLEAARAGEDLVLVASFHGLLDTARRATAATPIRPRILVCHGDADPLVPRSGVMAFWEEMEAAGAQWQFNAYGGVRHGFTDPEAGGRGMAALGYDASADRQSWAAFASLADEVFDGGDVADAGAG